MRLILIFRVSLCRKHGLEKRVTTTTTRRRTTGSPELTGSDLGAAARYGTRKEVCKLVGVRIAAAIFRLRSQARNLCLARRALLPQSFRWTRCIDFASNGFWLVLLFLLVPRTVARIMSGCGDKRCHCDRTKSSTPTFYLSCDFAVAVDFVVAVYLIALGRPHAANRPGLPRCQCSHAASRMSLRLSRQVSERSRLGK